MGDLKSCTLNFINHVITNTIPANSMVQTDIFKEVRKVTAIPVSVRFEMVCSSSVVKIASSYPAKGRHFRLFCFCVLYR